MDNELNNRFIPYIYKKNFLTSQECDSIKERIYTLQEVEEVNTYINKKNYYFRFNSDDLIFKKISNLINKVNDKYFSFDITISENVELYYYKKDHFFDYHMDLYKGSSSRRKLTFLILLSDGKDFEGGDLEFFSNNVGKLPRVKGTIAIYPSFIMHRVTKIINGERFTLGGECLGNPFR